MQRGRLYENHRGANFHIGEGKMYELLREYEGAKWVLRNGNRLMIKKNLFARWLDQQTEI